MHPPSQHNLFHKRVIWRVIWGSISEESMIFYLPFLPLILAKDHTFPLFLWAPLPYQGYSQDAEGDANTNIHPTNMFSGEEEKIETHICVISGQEQKQSTLSQFKMLKKFTFESID